MKMTEEENNNTIDGLLFLLSDPHHSRYSTALRMLVAERDALIAECDGLRSEREIYWGINDEQIAELAEMCQQRDEARQALQKSHDAMVLAKASHGCILACDPPLDAWKHRCVDVHLGDAIRECAAAMRKGATDGK
jgi:hypothetical protein